MNLNPRQIDDLLARLAAGELDSLSPGQIDALAERLDREPELAARLAGVTPPRDARLQAGPALPGARVWDAMFERIESEVGGVQSAGVRRLPGLGRWLRLGSGLSAAACLLLAFLLWRSPASDPSGDGGEWVIGLSDDVEVLEVETDAGYDSFVSYAPDGGASMIWIYEAPEGEEAPS
jgi:hypothetical protein